MILEKFRREQRSKTFFFNVRGRFCAIFDNFHALANPIRQDILRVGAVNQRF